MSHLRGACLAFGVGRGELWVLNARMSVQCAHGARFAPHSVSSDQLPGGCLDLLPLDSLMHVLQLFLHAPCPRPLRSSDLHKTM